MPHPYITAASKKYKRALAQECRRLFSNTHLPSHDHLHHARVWHNSSLVLSRLYESGMVTVPAMAEKAIIAAYFHDTGLTVNRGADHGAVSRQICSEFLKKCNFGESERNEILDAVEKHDDKDYPAISDPASLVAIVSVADDMDAFGERGIGRYLEIYSLRGVPDAMMPQTVILNVTSRFRHLESTYWMFPDLVDKQRKRVKTVIDYFADKKL
jgi:HD superfamily phosphodiesterase